MQVFGRIAFSLGVIRLLICDDSDSFRFVVRSTLAEQPGITVVGEASDGREAVDLALALSPDVILMDVRMPVLDGVEATRAVRSALPDVRVVALTGSDDRQIVSAMLEAGASAYCVKGSPLSELERADHRAPEPARLRGEARPAARRPCRRSLRPRPARGRRLRARNQGGPRGSRRRRGLPAQRRSARRARPGRRWAGRGRRRPATPRHRPPRCRPPPPASPSSRSTG